MQASNPFPPAIFTQPIMPDRNQSTVPFLLRQMRQICRGDVIAETGLIIIGIWGLQPIVAHICSNCWQIALLFTFIGLMVFSLFGQYYLNQTQSKFVNHCTTISNIIIALLGIGVIACILTTPVIV